MEPELFNEDQNLSERYVVVDNEIVVLYLAIQFDFTGFSPS
jgi:hypothetical protein